MKTYRPLLGLLATTICLYALNACSGHNRQITLSGYAVRYLASDGTAAGGIAADNTDAHLKNAWGLVFNPAGFAWVANNGTSVVTLYDGAGVLQPSPIVSLAPAANGNAANPTGIVYNGTADFVLTRGSSSSPALFLFDGEGGTLAAWNPAAGNGAQTVHDDGTGGAVYKGLAIGNNAGANFLYATDFHNNKIDTFDTTFAKVTTTGGFADATIPAGFAPFGIQNIGGRLYVTYAQQDAVAHDNVSGPGLGYVDLFDLNGVLIRRVASGGALNAPWGVALAPANFGVLSNDLLIANFGDGLIDAYDPVTGAFVRGLNSVAPPGGVAIRISGLWGIAFGNGLPGQPTNALFFAAGSNREVNGAYGRIDSTAVTITPGTGGYGGG